MRRCGRRSICARDAPAHHSALSKIYLARKFDLHLYGSKEGRGDYEPTTAPNISAAQPTIVGVDDHAHAPYQSILKLPTGERELVGSK
jgi:hypothetical protein